MYTKVVNRISKFSWTSLACLAMIGLMAACQRATSSTTREAAFDTLFPFEFNERLVLTQPEVLRQSSGHGVVDLLLENRSDDPVMTASEDGPRMFVYSAESQEWVEILDSIIHTEGDQILSPTGGPLAFDFVSVSPVLASQGGSIEIRTVVVGRVMDGDRLTDERIGAFIDVTVARP